MNLAELFAPLVGKRIHGGCELCDAYQTIRPIDYLEWGVTVFHDDDCPRIKRGHESNDQDDGEVAMTLDEYRATSDAEHRRRVAETFREVGRRSPSSRPGRGRGRRPGDHPGGRTFRRAVG